MREKKIQWERREEIFMVTTERKRRETEKDTEGETNGGQQMRER